MIQSQKLSSIESLILQNKEREISFFSWEYFLSEDKITQNNYDVIGKKYCGFENILWWYVYTQILEYPPIFWIVRKILKLNSYARKSFPLFPPWTNIETIFKIQDREVYINSFLQFIDDEKKTLHIKDKGSSQEYVLDVIKSSKKKLGVTKFSLSFTIKKYLQEPVLIYEELIALQDMYKIENIQIFQWKFVFTLSQIWEEITRVEFNWEDILINSQKIYFQNRTTFIKDYIKLIFAYLEKYSVNEVSFVSLEEYYNLNQLKYPKVNRDKFTYDEVRKSIEEKWKEISTKHKLNSPFFGISTSSISCHYYTPE